MDDTPETMPRTFPAVMAFLDRYFVQHMAESITGFHPTECAFPLRCFTNEWVTQEIARGVLRSLTDRGYCNYRRGLMTDSGEMAGAGYGLTEKGIAYYRELCPEGEMALP